MHLVLTRLTVRGFKNLLDVDLCLGPFTCLVGENAVGKSNLFDAIRFLHLLASRPIPEAVSNVRESRGRPARPADLFTGFGGTRAADEIRIAAEMIVKPTAVDDFSVEATASITSLRYEVAFELDEAEDRLVLKEEHLSPITLGQARKNLSPWAKPGFLKSVLKGARRGRGRDLISTTGGRIQLHQDGHGGRKVPSAGSSRTVLSSANADFPTALAAKREMESWRSLQLEPSAMRAPSLYTDPKQIDERGAFLAAALQRLAKLRGPEAWAEIAERVSRLVPEMEELRVVSDDRTETHTAEIRGVDKTFRPARALSDGTLRFLVLAALTVDPDSTGTLCIEEPENGIHPERIADMTTLLYDLAVDPNVVVGTDNPLRQVLVNTHSPLVYKEVRREDLVFLESVDIVRDRTRGRGVAIRVPGGTWRANLASPAHRRVQPARTLAWEQMEFRFRAAEEP
jgi:predicted ATPase